MEINHIICLVLILMGSLQSCAEMDKTSDFEGPRKLSLEAAKEKIVYVGLITAESKFHPWMKEIFLSQDIFESCFIVPNDQSIAIVLRWKKNKERWIIDEERSDGGGDELMKCVAQQFEMWLAKRLSRVEEGGFFYLLESKDQLNLGWPANGEKYIWRVRFEKKRRVFQ